VSNGFTSGFGLCESPKAMGVSGAASLDVDVLNTYGEFWGIS